MSFLFKKQNSNPSLSELMPPLFLKMEAVPQTSDVQNVYQKDFETEEPSGLYKRNMPPAMYEKPQSSGLYKRN